MRYEVGLPPMQNRFFFIPDKGRDVVEWNIAGPAADIRGDASYFFEILVTAHRVIGPSGLDFYVTWDLDWLPRVAPNVVVVLLGDERYLMPSYQRRVLAVFKTGGISSFSPFSPFDSTRVLWTIDRLRTLRDTAVRARRAWVAPELRGLTPTNLFLLPIGYNGQIEVASKPLSERTHDVLFAGQIAARGHSRFGMPASFTLRPREWSRASMASALHELASAQPSITCHWLGKTSERADPLAYSEALANAKISLCPRGNFPETYRFCESARAGCVIVSEPLPPTWYFRDHPALIVRHWQELPAIVRKLVSEPALLEAHHRKSRAWWSDVAGESAVGAYVAECLLPLLRRSGSGERTKKASYSTLRSPAK